MVRIQIFSAIDLSLMLCLLLAFVLHVSLNLLCICSELQAEQRRTAMKRISRERQYADEETRAVLAEVCCVLCLVSVDVIYTVSGICCACCMRVDPVGGRIFDRVLSCSLLMFLF